jgi:hypothetical protein
MAPSGDFEEHDVLGGSDGLRLDADAHAKITAAFPGTSATRLPP